MLIEVKLPFNFCEKCLYADLQTSIAYEENRAFFKETRCCNERKCEYVIGLFKEEHKNEPVHS